MKKSKCKLCSKKFVKKVWNQKYCFKHGQLMRKKSGAYPVPRRFCSVCKEPSWGKKHAWCDYPSAYGARSKLSVRNSDSKRSRVS